MLLSLFLVHARASERGKQLAHGLGCSEMDSDHDELNFSCLPHRKLNKQQMRRQVKRVTSAAVMLLQVVSPATPRKKFKDADIGGRAHPPEGAVNMEPASNAERIVHCVLKHQDNRMLSPVCEAGSPDFDCGTEYCTRGSYRYCSPTNFHHSSVLHSRMDGSSVEHQAAGVLGGKRFRSKNRLRSMSMSVACTEPNCSFAEDCHNAPLMCLDDDASRRACEDSKGARRNPLRQIGNLLGCFLGMRRENAEKKSWEKSNRSLALLELSQRQQNALAMKQDTIELLEWKLEQLQLLSATAAVPPSRKYSAASLHNPDLQPIPACIFAGGFYKRYSTDEEVVGKTLQDKLGHPQEQYFDLQSLKLENAEFSAIVHLFEMTAIKARLAVRYFCKIFMKQMEVSGYSVWRTLAEVEPTTKFQHKEHTAFILESRLNTALYHSFENDSFDDTGLTRIIDPEKRCIIRFQDFQRLKLVEAANAVNTQHKDFDHEFWTFSETKMRDMWFLFPWNVVFKDSDERSSFTAAFLDAAKCVWLLHRLAFSVHPHVTILRVGKGMHANSQYVEQVTPIDEGCKRCEGPKVEFMSMPGFQIRKKIIKCQVYRHLQCQKVEV